MYYRKLGTPGVGEIVKGDPSIDIRVPSPLHLITQKENSMTRIPEALMEPKRKEFFEKMGDPAFIILTDDEKGKIIGVTGMTMFRWRQQLTAEDWERISKLRDGMLVRETLEVDSAVINKAKAGDIEAAKLYYQKLTGWSPKQTNENINKNAELEGMSEEELLMKSLDGIPAEVLAKVLSKKGLGAPSVATEEPKKAENGV